jgi:enamine deaminase RidA (YjgF/YER057c/UK114 family)
MLQTIGRQTINPSTLQPAFPGYAHAVSFVPQQRLIYISGQTAVTATGSINGKGDFAVQFAQALDNIALALAETDASFDDVVKLNYYIVNYSEEYLMPIMETLNRYVSIENPPAATMLHVNGLYLPDLLVEIEAIAAI